MILPEADTMLAPVTEIDGFVLACLMDASTGMVLTALQEQDGISLPTAAAARRTSPTWCLCSQLSWPWRTALRT